MSINGLSTVLSSLYMLSILVPTTACNLALCFHLIIEIKTQRGFINLPKVLKFWEVKQEFRLSPLWPQSSLCSLNPLALFSHSDFWSYIIPSFMWTWMAVLRIHLLYIFCSFLGKDPFEENFQLSKVGKTCD